jgi:transcription elongation factor GreA
VAFSSAAKRRGASPGAATSVPGGERPDAREAAAHEHLGPVGARLDGEDPVVVALDRRLERRVQRARDGVEAGELAAHGAAGQVEVAADDQAAPRERDVLDGLVEHRRDERRVERAIGADACDAAALHPADRGEVAGDVMAARTVRNGLVDRPVELRPGLRGGARRVEQDAAARAPRQPLEAPAEVERLVVGRERRDLPVGDPVGVRKRRRQRARAGRHEQRDEDEQERKEGGVAGHGATVSARCAARCGVLPTPHAGDPPTRSRPPLPDALSSTPMEGSHLMTADGYETLRKEVEHLETVAREEIAKQIKTAREWGDLKENAEYHAAKDAQAHLETRILTLREQLDNAEVVEKVQGDVVGFGSTVEVEDESTKRRSTYTLVAAYAAVPREGKLSSSRRRPRPCATPRWGHGDRADAARRAAPAHRLRLLGAQRGPASARAPERSRLDLWSRVRAARAR